MGMNLLLTSFRLSENSVPCGHRTEVWISVLVVGRKPLWTQSLPPCSSHCSLHHKTSNSTGVFLVLWVSLISPSAFGHGETLILRALTTQWDFPGCSVVKSGRPPGEGNGNPLQYSLPRKFHGQRNLAGYSPWGWQRVSHDWACQYSGKESVCHVGDVSSVP